VTDNIYCNKNIKASKKVITKKKKKSITNYYTSCRRAYTLFRIGTASGDQVVRMGVAANNAPL